MNQDKFEAAIDAVPTKALAGILAEYGNAASSFPPMNSAHEGFAVLKEEVDELWEAVRMKQGGPGRLEHIRKEAVQVAAMALRFIVDVCDAGNNK